MKVIISIFLAPLLLVLIRNRIKKDIFQSFIKKYLNTFLFVNGISAIVSFLCWHLFNLNDPNFYYLYTYAYLLFTYSLAILSPFFEDKITIYSLEDLKKKKVNWERLFYIFVISLFLMNFIRIFDNAFWGDEGFSIRLAKMSLSEMIKATADDVHPPLYYMFLQVLYKVFGNHGITYHLSGFLPYAAIVVISATWVKKRFGITTASILVGFASISNNALIYNVEARMYSLAALFVLCAYLSLYEILHDNKDKYWYLLGIFAVLASYTHYYSFVSVALLYLGLIIHCFLDHRYIKKTIKLCLFSLIGYAPWFLVLLSSFKRTSAGWWSDAIPTYRSCYMFLFDNDTRINIFFIILICFLFHESKTINIQREERNERGLFFNLSIKKGKMDLDIEWILIGLLSLFGTMCVGISVSKLLRPLFLTRYLYPVAPLAYLVMGFGTSRLPYRRLVGFALVFLLIFDQVPYYQNMVWSEIDLNLQTKEFLEVVKPDERAVIYTNDSHLDWTLLDYYYPLNEHVRTKDATVALRKNVDDIWLFWSAKMDTDFLMMARNKGYRIELVHESRFANDFYYKVYHLTKANSTR